MSDISYRINHFVTEDGIDHGLYHVEDCLGAVIARCEDGYIHCVLIWSGGSCEECMEIFEKRMEREETDV